jgi:hypothetical protein
LLRSHVNIYFSFACPKIGYTYTITQRTQSMHWPKLMTNNTSKAEMGKAITCSKATPCHWCGQNLYAVYCRRSICLSPSCIFFAWCERNLYADCVDLYVCPLPAFFAWCGRNLYADCVDLYVCPVPAFFAWCGRNLYPDCHISLSCIFSPIT